jgi:predicted phage terminase large subunit-like protein
MDFPDLKQAVIRLQKRWQADKVLIEDAGSGKSLWQELRATGSFMPLMMSVTKSKEERFTGCLAEVEAGRFVLPEVSPWIEQFRAELRAFPSGRHDDQVDSFSQFAGWQLRDWRWVLTERDATGRARRLVRDRKRPF